MTSNRTRLLIVADNSRIAEAIHIGFRKSRECQLIGLVDGRTACARSVLDPQPDVVLLDDIDGSDRPLELTSEITQEAGRVVVIVLSLQMDGDRLARLFDVGATAVISTATHPGALATLVRETLNGDIVHKLAPPRTNVGSPPRAAATEVSPLTERELEILKLVAAGSSNGDIARRLWVTEQTVKFHPRNVYRKLDVANPHAGESFRLRPRSRRSAIARDCRPSTRTLGRGLVGTGYLTWQPRQK